MNYPENDYRNYLAHHGILGMKWGVKNGPPYPLGIGDHNASERKAGWQESLKGKFSTNKTAQASDEEYNKLLNERKRVERLIDDYYFVGFSPKDLEYNLGESIRTDVRPFLKTPYDSYLNKLDKKISKIDSDYKNDFRKQELERLSNLKEKYEVSKEMSIAVRKYNVGRELMRQLFNAYSYEAPYEHERNNKVYEQIANDMVLGQLEKIGVLESKYSQKELFKQPIIDLSSNYARMGGKDAYCNPYSWNYDNPSPKYKNSPQVREAMRLAKANGWSTLTNAQQNLIKEAYPIEE